MTATKIAANKRFGIVRIIFKNKRTILVMIGFLVDQLEGKDRQVWRESLVGSNSFYMMNRRD